VGFADLFSAFAVSAFIQLLIVQTFWYAAAGLVLLVRAGRASDIVMEKA
jgi:hypothetical protein